MDLGTVRRGAIVVAVVIGVLAFAVVAGLRAAGSRRSCNLMLPSPSAVSVELPGPGWTVTELCLGDDCEPNGLVDVGDDADVYPFRVTLLAPDGTVVERSGEVATVEESPNGEGCGTRAYGRISVDVGGIG